MSAVFTARVKSLYPERFIRDLGIAVPDAELREEAARFGFDGVRCLSPHAVWSMRWPRLIYAIHTLAEVDVFAVKRVLDLRSRDAMAAAFNDPELRSKFSSDDADVVNGSALPEAVTCSIFTNYINWRLFGSRVFLIGAGLGAALESTDFRSPVGDIKPPFPCVYVAWTRPAFTIDHSDGTRMPAEGCFVAGDVPGIAYAPNREPGTYLSNVKPGPSLMFCATSIPDRSETSNIYQFNLNCGDPTRLIDSGERRSFTETDADDKGLDVIKAAINAVLYMSSKGAEVEDMPAPNAEAVAVVDRTKSSKKRAKAERAAVAYSALPYVLVGRSIRIDKRLDEPGAAAINEDESDSARAWRLGYRLQIRGHWKRQPFGEGRTERKWLWIKPYWKGPELADVVHRRYAVSGSAKPEKSGEPRRA